MTRFSEGDFVLAATATGRSGHKFEFIWRGPKRAVRDLNDYTFEVQDIVPPFTIPIRHASRLRLYREVEELQEQAIYVENGHLVDALRQCRLSTSTHRWELEVIWYRLDDIEAPWKPVEAIKEGVPVLFQAFIDALPNDPARADMSRALDSPSPGSTAHPPRVLRLPRPRRRCRGPYMSLG